MWSDMVLVGRIARPHGLRGQVVVAPETDFVEERFRPGSVVWTRSDRGEEALTVNAFRLQKGRAVIGIEGFARVEDVERLSGLELRVPEDRLTPLAKGTYYHHQLIGCAVETVSGKRVGDVKGVQGGAGSNLLLVESRDGEVLVPLAEEICVEVDVIGRKIRIDPPDGLLELNWK